jgi:hypothetical protein
MDMRRSIRALRIAVALELLVPGHPGQALRSRLEHAHERHQIGLLLPGELEPQDQVNSNAGQIYDVTGRSLLLIAGLTVGGRAARCSASPSS